SRQLDDMHKGYGSDAEFNQALAEQGITLDDLKQDLKTQLERRLKAQHALRQKQQDLPQSLVVTDSQARQYYDQHQEDFNQAHFAIILFKMNPGANPVYVKEVRAQAQHVLDDLKAGGDFAAAAKKYSEDPGSADRGGDVGMVARSALEPELAKGVFSTPVGGMSLVRGADGFYIVKVLSRQQADFDSVASQIKDQLRASNQDQALRDWVESLKKKVYVQYSKSLAAEAAADLPYNPLNATPSAPLTVAPAGAAAPAAAAGGAVATSSPVPTSTVVPVYSSLPDEGNTALDLTISPWGYGTADLAQNYGAGTDVSQGFPFGLEAQLGLETTLDPQLQLGAFLQVMDKITPTVTAGGTTAHWEEAAVGLLAGPKVLLPLSPGLNLDLYAQGGYFFLFGTAAKFDGAQTGSVYLDGSNFGGQVGADLEFFLDYEKTFALDLGCAYRRLLVNPTVHGAVAGYPLPGYQVDFSGFKSVLGFRFYLDK
ncbi:MAG TPA: peptidylprolyl isomerase, partial [bacterium]|nr:peptidylprolyl isomerase [bacterium]